MKWALRQITSSPLQRSCKSETCQRWIFTATHPLQADISFQMFQEEKQIRSWGRQALKGGQNNVSQMGFSTPHLPPHLTRRVCGSDSRLERRRLWEQREGAEHHVHPSALHHTHSVEPGCSLSRPAVAGGVRRWGSLHHLKGLRVGQAGWEFVPLWI